MSSYSRLGIAAACGVALFFLVDLVLTHTASPDTRFWYGAGVRILVYAIAAIAAGRAAATFGWWSEDIGRPWTLFFVEFGLLLINYIIRRTAPNASMALDATLVIANIAQLWAYWLVSRMLQSAGIGYLMSSTRRIVLTVSALALAILISYSTLLTQWHALRNGTLNAASLIALITDVATFTLIAPLAISTFMLRGGQVFWVFAFLTISVCGWMFNEAGSWIATSLGSDNDVLRRVRMAGAATAALFNAAAAATQWLSARRAVAGAKSNA